VPTSSARLLRTASSSSIRWIRGESGVVMWQAA
jgi:hypothetical protein